MKVCITGGSGFIGSYFYDSLAREGHGMRILDLHAPTWDASAAHFVEGDIRNETAMLEAAAGCDALIHLAAAHHDFGIDYETYFSVNVDGARTICAAADRIGLRRIVFYSTVAVYGDAPTPHDENTTPSPESPYGKSKLEGERVFEEWTGKGGGRRCLVIRPTVTFGPRNFANMYSLIRQIHSGRFMRVGPGVNIKSLSYIENIVDATLYLWSRTDLPAYDVYNYIDKPDLTSRAISEQVYEALDRRMPRLAVPMAAARLAVLPFDLIIALTGKNISISGARVKKLFSTQTKFESDKILDAGYTPKVTLREGINRMVRWYLESGKEESAEWHQPPAKVVAFAADD